MNKRFFLIGFLFLAIGWWLQSCAAGKNKIREVYVFESEVDSNMIKCYKGIPFEESTIPDLNPVKKRKKSDKKSNCHEDGVLYEMYNYQKLVLRKDSTCIYTVRSDFYENLSLTDTGIWYVGHDTIYTHYEGEMFLTRWQLESGVMYQCARSYIDSEKWGYMFDGWVKGYVPLKKKWFKKQ